MSKGGSLDIKKDLRPDEVAVIVDYCEKFQEAGHAALLGVRLDDPVGLPDSSSIERSGATTLIMDDDGVTEDSGLIDWGD